MRTHGNPHGRTLRGQCIDLGPGIGTYSLEEYWRAQRAGTEWMRTRSEAMCEMVAATMGRSNGTRRGRRPPGARVGPRVKSYLLQEAEAISRRAKQRWCRENGITVIHLQHDGVVAHGATDPGAAARDMSAAATAACGYEVTVGYADLAAPALAD